MVLLINLELSVLFLDWMIIPFPILVSAIASTLRDIPNVAPFLFAMAFTIDIAP